MKHNSIRDIPFYVLCPNTLQVQTCYIRHMDEPLINLSNGCEYSCGLDICTRCIKACNTAICDNPDVLSANTVSNPFRFE